MNPAISTSLTHDMVSSGVLARTSGSMLTLQTSSASERFPKCNSEKPYLGVFHRANFLIIRNSSGTMEKSHHTSRFLQNRGLGLLKSAVLVSILIHVSWQFLTQSTHRVPVFLRHSRTGAKHASGAHKSQGLAGNVG